VELVLHPAPIRVKPERGSLLLKSILKKRFRTEPVDIWIFG